MRYRRNADSRLRKLERRLHSGDLTAAMPLTHELQRTMGAGPDFVDALLRNDLLPRIPEQPYQSTGQLPAFFEHIDPQYWYPYTALISELVSRGIPFGLRPNGATCGCEHSNCQHPVRNDYCYDCNIAGTMVPLEEFYDLDKTHVFDCACGRRFTGTPDYKKHAQDCGGDPEVVGTLREVAANAQDEGWSRYDIICTKCKDIRGYYTPGDGPCGELPWRGYNNDLGGICDFCFAGYPQVWHSNICQCLECSEGIGPLILLRTRMMPPRDLESMLDDYETFYGDGRKVDVAFSIDRDSEYAENWWTEYGYDNDNGHRKLDTLSLHCIEIRPNGGYRLREYSHLNEKMILPRFREILDHRLAQPGPPGAKELFRCHMLGRDFSLPELIDHLAVHNTPNMPQFIQQVYDVVKEEISFDAIFQLDRIDPTLREFECLGYWSPPAPDFYIEGFLTSQRTLAGFSELPLRVVFSRHSQTDTVTFYLLGDRFGDTRQEFNRPYSDHSESKKPTLENITKRLGWALDRAQRSPMEGHIQPGRLEMLINNFCPHGYQSEECKKCGTQHG
jgi:hypothetical protein